MTAGSEALREAARLESARVYGTTCPEHHNRRRRDDGVLDEVAIERRINGRMEHLTTPELREAVRLLQARGMTANETARRLRISGTRVKAIIAESMFTRPLDSYYGPAAPELIAELIAPEPAERLSTAVRIAVECAIARGEDPMRIAERNGLTVAQVNGINAAMEAA